MLQQIANLKKGDDVMDEYGNIRYTNESLTLPPRKSRTYAYCSDTAFETNIVEQLRHIDLLYHEATFIEEDSSRASDTKHSTAKQAATVAQLAEVKTLILGHFSARYKDLNPILEEAKSIFANSKLALEGEEFIVAD